MSGWLIVWDIDGVLNANMVEGRFACADKLHADWGIDRDEFVQYVFQSERMQRVVRGQTDVADAILDWSREAECRLDAEALLDDWFERDALPDHEVIGILASSAGRDVIGTNNEARRAEYIETKMGFSQRVETVFASGRRGYAKPDDAYFQQIERGSTLPVEQHILIDDAVRKKEAAQRHGWVDFHFTDVSRKTLAGFLADAP